MNIHELIETLTEVANDVGGEAEVRLMTQPNWPMDNRVSAVRVVQTDDEKYLSDIQEEIARAGACPELSEMVMERARLQKIIDETTSVVHIVEGGHVGYGSKQAWEE